MSGMMIMLAKGMILTPSNPKRCVVLAVAEMVICSFALNKKHYQHQHQPRAAQIQTAQAKTVIMTIALGITVLSQTATPITTKISMPVRCAVLAMAEIGSNMKNLMSRKILPNISLFAKTRTIVQEVHGG